MRLNGWVRIGIVASVLWVLGAGFYFYSETVDQAVVSGNFNRSVCETEKKEGKHPADYNCYKAFTVASDKHMAEARPYVALLTLIPLAFFWGFAYLIVFVWRWVAKGFKRDPQ